MLLLLVDPAYGARPVPRLDQQGYYQQLLAQRPDLMTRHTGSVRDPAWQALVIRPGYREEILGTTATYQSILDREYTPELRASDTEWATTLREAQIAYTPTATLYPAGYALDAYVGYQLGKKASKRDAEGYSYKAFFEFLSFQQSLTPGRYLAFSEALERAGFQGDSKIDLRPGQTRFLYNNVIVHAPSAALAQCAETVGLAFFRREIAHVARGVDAPPGPGESATDWHHFLLRDGFARLTDTVKDFIRYRTAPTPCPNQ